MKLPRVRLFLFTTTASILAWNASLHAQSPQAAEGFNAAYELFSQGNYPEAATAYEKLVKDYPTDLIVQSAQIQLGFSYYFMAQFDKALEILKKAESGPPLPEELKQVVDGLIPQILSAKAGAMPDGDPKRKAAFEDAVKKFTDFINKYPQAPDLENVIFSRAIANFQLQKYEDVVKDLEMNIQKFPQSSTIAASKNLLAITLATEGSIELSKGGDKAQAFALYDRAADLLREIIKNRRDIALYNDANFQLGEILFNKAGFSEPEQQPSLFKEALEAYRSIAPKEEIVKLQEEKIKSFPELRREAIKSRNDALRKQLDKDNERELKKLAELQAKPDQVASAMLKMAEIYFQQGDYNAARVLLRHVTPFLKEPVDNKRSLYFTTMTYGLQSAKDKAVENYNEFQTAFKGDALADNLPVTMGNMYLGLGDPNEAIRYFDESLAIYPQGRFAGLSVVSKASAETRIGNLDSALQTFKDYLSKNPPPEIAVIAQSGLAGIYKDTQKWDDAIAAYKVVTDKYPNTPQAIEAQYWIAIATQQKGDNSGALPLLDAFVKAHGDHPLAPLALYSKGGAEIALTQKDAGIATLAEVAEKYPDSQPAPYTYFVRAQLRGADGKADEVIALMKQFIAKYPKDDKVFAAYDSVASANLASGHRDEALAAYREFAANYPDSPQAADALNKIADLQRAAGEAIGRYAALSPEERAQWKVLIEGSVASAEELLQKYPDSPQVALVLRTLLQDQRLLLGAELKQAAQVEQYFQNLADNAGTPMAKSKILFALADYVGEQDQARSLEIMTKAYDPAIVYSPQDMDVYGMALIRQKKLDEALTVFNKLAADYPLPVGTPMEQVPLNIKEAQAFALFGQARVAQEKGQTEESGKLFTQLKSLYPWSPKVLEANYGIAESLKGQGKTDEALGLLTGIIRAPTATAELRANSMLLGGYLMLDKYNAATDPKQKEQFLGAAIDYFIKIAQFYGGVPQAAAKGLWEGSQLIEQQVNASTDAKFKAEQLKKAKLFYEQLVKDYPNSEYAEKAKARLAALGGAK